MKNLVLIITAIYFATILLIGVFSYSEIAKRASNKMLAYSSANGNLYLSDFLYFHTTGKMALSADRANVYEASSINRNLPEEVKEQGSHSDFILIAMPYFIVLMSPWSFLDVHLAMICWNMVSLAALLFAIVLILRNLRKSDSIISIAGFCAVILACQPAWFNVFIGHACFFQFLFLALFLIFFKKDKPLIAAFSLALASYKPQFVLPLLVPILAHKKYKLLALTAFFGFLFVLLSTCVLGLETVLSVPGKIAHWESEHGDFSAHMIGLLSLMEIVIPHKIAYYVACIIYLGAIITTYFYWRKTNFQSESYLYAGACAVLIGLVLSPHAQGYDAVLSGIAACLLMPTNGFAGFKNNLSIKEKILFSLFVTYPFLSWVYFLLVAAIPQSAGYTFAITHLLMLGLVLSIWREKTNQ